MSTISLNIVRKTYSIPLHLIQYFFESDNEFVLSELFKSGYVVAILTLILRISERTEFLIHVHGQIRMTSMSTIYISDNPDALHQVLKRHFICEIALRHPSYTMSQSKLSTAMGKAQGILQSMQN